MASQRIDINQRIQIYSDLIRSHTLAILCFYHVVDFTKNTVNGQFDQRSLIYEKMKH